MTVVRRSAGIRASPLHPNEAAHVVDSKGSRAMGIPDVNGKIVLRVEQANRAGLFLCEIDAAIRGAHEAVGVVASLPHELAFGFLSDGARVPRNRHMGLTGRLGEVRPP